MPLGREDFWLVQGSDVSIDLMALFQVGFDIDCNS